MQSVIINAFVATMDPPGLYGTPYSALALLCDMDERSLCIALRRTAGTETDVDGAACVMDTSAARHVMRKALRVFPHGLDDGRIDMLTPPHEQGRGARRRGAPHVDVDVDACARAFVSAQESPDGLLKLLTNAVTKVVTGPQGVVVVDNARAEAFNQKTRIVLMHNAPA